MSGLTKPSERFQQNVEPAFSDYFQNPLSERHANNLAGELNNQLEWNDKYYQQVDHPCLKGATLKSFRTDLLERHPALCAMNDLADAARHRELEWPQDPPRVVTLSTDAYYQKDGVLYVKGFDRPFSSMAEEAGDYWRKQPD
jgi:hypothetical protein